MSEIIKSPGMSTAGTLWTTVRHVVYPIIGGAFVAAIETAMTGQFDVVVAQKAALIALLAGAARWIRTAVGETTLVK